jgi:hypothetical protein
VPGKHTWKPARTKEEFPEKEEKPFDSTDVSRRKRAEEGAKEAKASALRAEWRLAKAQGNQLKANNLAMAYRLKTGKKLE